MIKVFIGSLAMFLLLSCTHEPRLKHQHILIVTNSANQATQYYTGLIKPLTTQVIVSPTDATILAMPVQYGDSVTAGDLLFTLSSTKYWQEYKAALTTYLKAKSDADNAKAAVEEAKFLYKNELISKDEFKSKQTNFYGHQLVFIQAQDTLDSLTRYLNNPTPDLHHLTIADIDAITQTVYKKSGTEMLRIKAPMSGVLLAYQKPAEENKHLSIGDVVKQDEIVAIIGDMRGVSVRVHVNELTVNQLTLGQPVKITGVAFPADVLNGKIVRIDRQGESTSGSLASFVVDVVVPTLTVAQQKNLRVGMTVNVQVDLNGESGISIPIKAVHSQGDGYYVIVENPQTKTTQTVMVETGKTTADAVTITKGLKLGDRLVIVD